MSGRSRNSCWSTAKKKKSGKSKLIYKHPPKFDPKKPKHLVSGMMIPNGAGGHSMLPYHGEHPCFGQRQEWGCTKQAVWRMNGEHVLLHWCDDCKKLVTPRFEGAEWQQMEKRSPDPARN